MFTQQDVETARRHLPDSNIKKQKCPFLLQLQKSVTVHSPKKSEEPHHITGAMKPLKLNV